MPYYKTNHPEVLAAVEAMRLEREALHAVGDAFGAEFGGKPFYLRSCSDVHFGGLQFTPRRDKTFWTAPDRNEAQAPRAKPRAGATNEQREEHKALREKWLATYPKQRVASDGIYAAIGTDWGALMFCGIGYAERDGWFYVQTSAKLNDRMTEILGSEYDAAFKKAD